MTDKSVFVVIPAFNEAQWLAAVVRRVRSHHYRAVCVDDGSSDGTAAVAAANGCDLLVHPVNLGQGAALQTGFDYALQEGADIVCTIDADGQHEVDDLPRLIDALHGQRAEFALGSRFLGRAVDMPLARRLILRAAVLFTRLTTGLPVSDTHNGIRAMTRHGATRICLKHSGMAHASELLGQIRASSLRMVEVPVTVSYTSYSRAKGQTSISAMRVLADLAAGRLRS